MADRSTVTRRDAPNARERLSLSWIVFPVVIALVVATVIVLGRLT